MQRLVIIGTGGHGREALDIVTAINEQSPTFAVLGFLDDGRRSGETAAPHRQPILGGSGLLGSLSAAYVLGIGFPATRARLSAEFQRLGCKSASLVHPTASMGSFVRYGPGLIMAAGARITHAVSLGEHVHMNVNATVSHDCVVGSHVTITPGVHVSGGVTVGDRVWLGIGAVVKQRVTIGHDATVGAGAVVVDDLPPAITAVGVPARPIR